MSDAVSIGVLGLGYWGPNLARNFAALPDAEVAWLCDGDESALDRQKSAHPSAKLTSDFSELLSDDSLDAVVIAAPVPAHAELALRAIQAGKHVFIEKPIGATLAEAEQVAAAAAASDRIVMVDHLLEYHPAVIKLRQLIEDGVDWAKTEVDGSATAWASGAAATMGASAAPIPAPFEIVGKPVSASMARSSGET